MKTKELKISGMSCGHCIMSVRSALGKLPGVSVKEVAIGKATVEYDERLAGDNELAEAVRQAGYTVVEG